MVGCLETTARLAEDAVQILLNVLIWFPRDSGLHCLVSVDPRANDSLVLVAVPITPLRLVWRSLAQQGGPDSLTCTRGRRSIHRRRTKGSGTRREG